MSLRGRMKVAALSAATLLCLGTGAFAGALGGDVTNVASAFNAKSKAEGYDVRMAKKSCQTEQRQACTYTIDKGLTVVAGSSADKKTLDSLALHLMTNDKLVIMKYLLSLATLLAVYVPDAGKDERGVVLKKIISDINDGDDAEVELHGVSIKLTTAAPFGMLTLVTRE